MCIRDRLKAESVWLVSSTRMYARVRKLNGKKLPAPDNAAEVQKLIVAALDRA